MLYRGRRLLGLSDVSVLLNWGLGEKTVNNRVYDTENFLNKLEEKIEEGLYIKYMKEDFSQEYLDNHKEEDILAKVEDYSITDNHRIRFVLDVRKGFEMSSVDEVTSCAIPINDWDNEELKIQEIKFLFPV